VGRITEKMGAYHLGFVLGPRINAGGRIGKADLGARLLSTDSQSEAMAIATELDALNSERRRVEMDIQLSCMAAVEALDQTDPVLIVAGEGWHPGVIGIVAARLMEKFKRPVCVVGIENGIGKASGRSRAGIDLGAMVIAARQAGILEKGGGHAMAAGFTIAASRIDDLRRFFREMAGSHVVQKPHLMIDGAMAATGATMELAMTIDRLAPYGAGHREPLLALLGARPINMRVVGETHVSCLLAGVNGGQAVKAIAFRALETDLGATLLAAGGQSFHLAGRLGIDRWQGRETVKFEIVDAAKIGV
jgi:single-stranded-DNA-specific exonuclease